MRQSALGHCCFGSNLRKLAPNWRSGSKWSGSGRLFALGAGNTGGLAALVYTAAERRCRRLWSKHGGEQNVVTAWRFQQISHFLLALPALSALSALLALFVQLDLFNLLLCCYLLLLIACFAAYFLHSLLPVSIMAHHLSTDFSFQFNDMDSDPIETLLMSSTYSFLENDRDSISQFDLKILNQNDDADDINDNEIAEKSDNEIGLSYIQFPIANDSPTYQYENPGMSNSFFSIYQVNDNDSFSDCNTNDVQSTISNIIYTNKMKEKLRRKRSYSSDLSLFSDSKISKSTNSVHSMSAISSTTQLSPLLNRRQQAISKSISSPNIRSNILSLSLSLKPAQSIKQMNCPSPTNARARNPFYRPPEILKRFSSDI